MELKNPSKFWHSSLRILVTAIQDYIPEVNVYYSKCLKLVESLAARHEWVNNSMLWLHICSQHERNCPDNYIEVDVESLEHYRKRKGTDEWQMAIFQDEASSFFLLNTLRSFLNMHKLEEDNHESSLSNVEHGWASLYSSIPFAVYLEESIYNINLKDADYVEAVLRSLAKYRYSPNQRLANDAETVAKYINPSINASFINKMIETSGSDYILRKIYPFIVDFLITYDLSRITKSECGNEFPRTVLTLLFDLSVTWRHFPDINYYSKIKQRIDLSYTDDFVPDAMKMIAGAEGVPQPIRENIRCFLPLLRRNKLLAEDIVAIISLNKTDYSIEDILRYRLFPDSKQ
uniref:(California timema) hypothetical protein n=1 Tax=Timema californicum TaxID=61474 RepID=A0A7R9JHR2_TIMCA|nr:unnamed protein product [Timema californicum]